MLLLIPGISNANTVAEICAQATLDNWKTRIINAKDTHTDLNPGFPYADSQAADQQTRKNAFRENETRMNLFMTQENTLSAPTLTPSYTYPDDRSQTYDSTISTSIVDPDDAKMRAVGPYIACGFSGANTCKKAFQEISDKMGVFYFEVQVTQRTGAVMLALPTELKKFATDPAFIAPMMKLADNLTGKMALAKNGISQLGDFFTDVQAAFSSSGLPEEQATENAWIVIGLYGARGAAMDSYYQISMGDPMNTSVFANLGRVATAISYLDGASVSAGKPYSYPAEVHTTCDFTRPYHFWLSAYLTHELLEEKMYSSKDIFTAVHGQEVVYEQFGGGQKGGAITTKESIDDVVKMKPHDSYLVETQKNIVFSDAGSFWALQRSDHLNSFVDADDLFMTAYNAEGIPDSPAKQELLKLISPALQTTTGYTSDTLFSWRTVMAPDADEAKILPRLR